MFLDAKTIQTLINEIILLRQEVGSLNRLLKKEVGRLNKNLEETNAPATSYTIRGPLSTRKT